ncbi:MAG: DUF3108 domain-containing protein [Bacteroidales bacterium]|nr:DUF3108 domain-containing protein [Bacteroidales bacterium]
MILFLSQQNGAAQCPFNKDFFSPKEFFTYDVHYAWGLIWLKGASMKMTTSETTYNGTQAIKNSLFIQTTGAVKKIFYLSDTLSGIVSSDTFAPLFFKKAAHEDKTYSYEEIFYSYPPNEAKARLRHYRNNTLRGDTAFLSKTCFYDTMSLLHFFRSMDTETLKKNKSVGVTLLFTDEAFNVTVTYKGIETIELDKEKIRTVKYTFSINGNAFENKKESIFLWMSDDNNHIPVQVETKLKIGSLKATLKKASGCKNSCDAFPYNTKIVK